jgi:cytochrome P450
MRENTQGIADRLVERMLAHGGPIDLVENFALPLPITVICEMLGVPYDDQKNFRTWSDAFLSTTRLTEEQVVDYNEHMDGYMSGLIAQRRADPADDLITALVAARTTKTGCPRTNSCACASGSSSRGTRPRPRRPRTSSTCC